ncbi:MAG: ATP-binding protein [Pseudomonadota bacterium]
MRKRIAFVGGVHGVGKSVFCSKLSEKFEFDHIIASSLINRVHHIDLKNKSVTNIENNQLILAQEIANYRTEKNTILLDGHFCLLDTFSNIQELPLEIFKAISPFVLFLLVDKPSTIARRLSKRDGREYSSEFVSIFQEREIKWAGSVGAAINAPIRIIDLSLDYKDIVNDVSLFLCTEGH